MMDTSVPSDYRLFGEEGVDFVGMLFKTDAMQVLHHNSHFEPLEAAEAVPHTPTTITTTTTPTSPTSPTTTTPTTPTSPTTTTTSPTQWDTPPRPITKAGLLADRGSHWTVTLHPYSTSAAATTIANTTISASSNVKRCLTMPRSPVTPQPPGPPPTGRSGTRVRTSSSCSSGASDGGGGGGGGGVGGGGGGARGRAVQCVQCAFCRRNGEAREFYTTHTLKDWRGVVVCPVLRAYTCPHCGATGGSAHTESHCPLTRYQPSLMATLRTRRSSCGKKHWK